MDADFLCQDIMEDSFLNNLLERLHGRSVDVVNGGPSCQSFSLAGRRKKLDKRDDLFYHYLKVIKALHPKYFVMENVRGILTKDEGRIKDRIIREIRSIIDTMAFGQTLDFLDSHLRHLMNPSLYALLLLKLKMEVFDDESGKIEEAFFDNLESQLRILTSKNLSYNVSKSNEAVNTVRHGLVMLRERKLREEIRKRIIQLKTSAHIDNDRFVDDCNAMVETISTEQIFDKMNSAIDAVSLFGNCKEDAEMLKLSL